MQVQPDTSDGQVNTRCTNYLRSTVRRMISVIGAGIFLMIESEMLDKFQGNNSVHPGTTSTIYSLGL